MRPTVKLGEILKFIRNGKSCKQNKERIGDRITRIETISDGTINENKVGFFELSEDDKEKYIIKKGDILFSHINSVEHIGKTAIAEKDYDNLYHGMNLLLLRCDQTRIYPKFLFVVLNNYFIKGYWGNVCQKAINQASLNQGKIVDIEIPLPPLETQKAIVAKLDQIFAELDQTKSEIQKNLDNTDEFSNSAGSKAFQEIGNIKILGEVCTMTQGIQIPLSDTITKFEPGYKRYIYISDLIDDDHIKYVRDIYPDKEVSENDLIMVNTGSTSGKIYWGKKGILSNNVFKIVGNENIIIQKYLYHYLKSYYFQSNLERQLKHGAQPHLGHKIMSKQIIPVPPLSEQEKIVEHLDQVSKEVKALKSQYQSQLDNLEELKKSVLDKAFRGEMG